MDQSQCTARVTSFRYVAVIQLVYFNAPLELNVTDQVSFPCHRQSESRQPGTECTYSSVDQLERQQPQPKTETDGSGICVSFRGL